jgi:hypothetical protein
MMPSTRLIGSPCKLSRSAPHDRDAAGDRGLEQQVATGGVGRCVQLRTDVGEQLLVGGDDRLAVGECLEDQPARRLDPADRLDDQIDVGIADHAVHVPGQHALGDLDVARRRQVADCDPRDLQPQTGAPFDGVLLRFDELHERGSDVAAPEYADPDRSPVARHGGEATGCGTVAP